MYQYGEFLYCNDMMGMTPNVGQTSTDECPVIACPIEHCHQDESGSTDAKWSFTADNHPQWLYMCMLAGWWVKLGSTFSWAVSGEEKGRDATNMYYVCHPGDLFVDILHFRRKATSAVGMLPPESTGVHNCEMNEVLMGLDHIIEVCIFHIKIAQIPAFIWDQRNKTSQHPTGCSNVKVWDPVTPHTKASGRKGAQRCSNGPWIVTKQIYQSGDRGVLNVWQVHVLGKKINKTCESTSVNWTDLNKFLAGVV
ncbi:hypothetical protein EDC04DRAFT_2608608 [Pisolithus marmoratus]|nr:hypothetical protein EDC04DRAFT_2608608 [Pisolithus marmoratus]